MMRVMRSRSVTAAAVASRARRMLSTRKPLKIALEGHTALLLSIDDATHRQHSSGENHVLELCSRGCKLYLCA